MRPNANGELISPDLGPKLVLAQSEGAIEIEPTPVPPKLAELSEEEIYAGLDPAVQEAILNADSVNGETIALTFGCIGCHALDPNEVKTGPTWHNIGDTAINASSGRKPCALSLSKHCCIKRICCPWLSRQHYAGEF